MNTTRKVLIALTGSAAALAMAAAPAFAETAVTEGPPPSDPIMQLAQDMMPRNQFVLDSQENIELLRYKSVRDVEICIARPDPDAIDGTSKTVPVEVDWDNDTGIIFPGNCMSFDAMKVKVRPAAPLPPDTELLGTFKVIH